MFGFNLADLIIILLLVGSVLLSVKMGLINQVLVAFSFFGALFASGWLVPHLLPFSDRNLKTIINANLVLVISVYAAVKGYDLSQRLHWNIGHKKPQSQTLKMLDAAFGTLSGLIGSLLAVWLLAVMISRMPFAGFSNSVADSKIVQNLVRELPPVPAVFAEFDRQINPNTTPSVLVEPQPTTDFNYSASAVQQAAVQANASVVRVTSFGCGGIVSGSGFVVAPDLVATNAHVLAGVKRPIVKYQGQSYAGAPVLFDPARDIAFLRLSGFKAPSLSLETPAGLIGDTVAILGYPGGNYTIVPGIIRNDQTVFSRNIYDVGLYHREIYEIQATVEQGSSGSPVVLPDGKVAGMVFSKSTDLPNFTFALTSSELEASLTRAQKSYQRVGTGACFAG